MHGECDPLTLTARELIGRALDEFVEPKANDPSSGGVRVGADAEVHLAPDAQPRKQRLSLRDVADAPCLGRELAELAVAQPDAPPPRAAQPGETAQGQGLAGAGGAEQREMWSLGDVGELELEIAESIMQIERQPVARRREAARGSSGAASTGDPVAA